MKIWNEFRSALKSKKAGVTYCIIDGLHELDEQSLKTAVEFFEGRFPWEGCLENESKLRILVLSHDRIQSNKFENINWQVRLDDETQARSEEGEMAAIDELLRPISEPHQTSCCEILEIIAAFWQSPTMEQLAWAFEESSEVLQQRFKFCRSFLRIFSDC